MAWFRQSGSVFQNQSGVLPRHCRSLFLAKVRPIHRVNALAESDQVGVRTTTGVNASLHHDHNKSKHAVSLAFALDELCLLEEWKKAAAVLVRNTD